MGLFDRFKKETKKEEPKESYSLDDSMYDISPPQEVDISTKMNELDKSAAVKNVNYYVGETAKKMFVEKANSDFDALYSDLKKFKVAFELLDKYGVKSDDMTDIMNKYSILAKNQIVNTSEHDKLFLPYLLEREALGIITNKEKDTLNILKNDKNIKQTYRKMVVVYDMLGLIDLTDEAMFSETFSQYGNLSQVNDDELVRISRKKFKEMSSTLSSNFGFDMVETARKNSR